MRIDARLVFAVALLGCGISSVGTFVDGDGTVSPDGDAGTDGAPSFVDANGEDDGSSEVDAAFDADASLPPAVFYVTTETKLYSYAPLTKTWTFLSNIGCANADEIAVNAKGEIWGGSIAQRALYRFDGTTFTCTKVAEAGTAKPWSYALSFVPKAAFGTADEVLVGYEGRNYVRIDPDGGSSTITTDALASGQAPSGDVVTMGSRAFVSVAGGTGCDVADCLIEINPTTGAIVKNWGTFPSNLVYAIAHWAGKIYGFRNTGEVYEVTLATPLVIKTLPGPDGGATFTGAGSSTLAPTQ